MKGARMTQACCCVVLAARARPTVRSEAGRRGSHTSQKARCMRHPAREDVPSPANCWERSRNVSWNQRFHKLRSHRGLVGPRERDASPSGDVERRDLGGAYVAVFAMCAVQGPLVEARTHRKRRDQCTTRPCSPMGDVRRLKSKFAKRTWNVAWNQQLHFFGVLLHHAIG